METFIYQRHPIYILYSRAYLKVIYLPRLIVLQFYHLGDLWGKIENQGQPGLPERPYLKCKENQNIK